MARINEAYEVLRDPARRAEYDRTQHGRDQGAFEENDAATGSGAFDSALREAEEKWSVACSIYPDLPRIRASLSKVSSSLVFAYPESVTRAPFREYDSRCVL